MKTCFSCFLLALGTASASVASPRLPQDQERQFRDALKRAAPVAPDGYVPTSVACPSTRPTIRAANGLSSQESSWLQKRRPETVSAMEDFLTRANIKGFNAASYIKTHASNFSALPNIAIAASGGGYRALMNGAGVIAAFDSRSFNSTATGQLGGLLQSATYVAGLSGGGWLVGSLFLNNFTSVQNIINVNGQLWDFSNSVFDGPQGEGTLSYLASLTTQVEAKKNAGYKTSITDFWGRALAYQLINATDGGISYTFSSIANGSTYSSGQTPMPLLVSDGKFPDVDVPPLSTALFEFTPYELGSWDSELSGFVPLQYVGSNFTKGVLPSSDSCIVGYDNAGFVMGTSSSLFNAALSEFNDGEFGLSTAAVSLIEKLIGPIQENNDDIADWEPNPFYEYNPSVNPFTNQDILTLVDGGENGENIPLNPLIQPVRAVDVIFAIDSSADTVAEGYSNWPNGTSLVATYQRHQLTNLTNNPAFPSIPDQNTFINLGLNNRPTFFGCDPSNYTSNLTHPGPLIVYLPNAPYNYLSNFSTFDLSYNSSERDATIGNGFAVATQGNGTLDANWPACVGCAILHRSLARTGTSVPEACSACFTQYCWNGTVDSSAVTYMPDYKLGKVTTQAGGGSAGGGSAGTALWGVERFWTAVVAAAAVGVAVGL